MSGKVPESKLKVWVEIMNAIRVARTLNTTNFEKLFVFAMREPKNHIIP
jgi:hypothetical protein